MARVSALFAFVGHLLDVPPPRDGELRDGVDALLMMAGEEEGPAVILAALLQALGEKAAIDYVPGMAFVRVELAFDDVARLPPWAALIVSRGRYFLPLDARDPHRPLGLLPRPARLLLGQRAGFAALRP